MFRAIILPVILMGFIGGPMLYSNYSRHKQKFATVPNQASTTTPWQAASYRAPNATYAPGAINTPVARSGYIPSPASAPGTFVNATTGFPPNPTFGTQRSSSVQVPVSNTAATFPTTIPGAVANPGFAQTNVQTVSTYSSDMAWAQPGMVPDHARTETLVFPGSANGPDLTAQPMSFTPTIDLASLFRFDVTKQFITSRWDRVSTSPATEGLHGMRVALVTGTNSWDLHGSLTYWFDPGHRVQRITYRGWTGDANRLLQILGPQHQLKALPTHWAGAYLSKSGGVLMKYPAVIDKSNTVQRLAIILELNNPRGKTSLSNDFQSLLPAATSAR